MFSELRTFGALTLIKFFNQGTPRAEGFLEL